MTFARCSLTAAVLVFSSQFASAQDLTRYRAYTLESSLESVLAAGSARPSDISVVHQRPAVIQELTWRPSYADSRSDPVDPVRQIVFSFCDNALYQVLVGYDATRTDGLSNQDIIYALTVTYGAPMRSSSRNRPLDAPSNTVVLAQWESDVSSLTLLRAVYSAEFQLLLTSKALGTRARGAIREATRLDIAQAPRREIEQRQKDAAEAAATLAKVHAKNKAAFRP